MQPTTKGDIFFSSFGPQGLPGFVGPAGPMGITGEKVRTFSICQILQESQLAAVPLSPF